MPERSMATIDKEMEKRRQAMKTRLEKAGTDNPIVAKAVKANEPRPDQDEWHVVDELVSAARQRYEEDGDMAKCAKELADSLMRVSKSSGKKSSEDDEEDDNRYEETT